MDKFHEQLLTTRKSPVFIFMTAAMVVLGFLAVIALSTITGGFNIGVLILFLLFGGAAVGAYFLRDMQYREYEYIFTNGNLEIDVIYNMKRRKVMLDKDVKDFEEFGRLTESGLSKDIYYALIADKQRSAYLIIPDEEMLKYINIYYKRRVR